MSEETNNDTQTELEQINSRLTELNKEFSDLSALKKKIKADEKKKNLANQWKDYKYRLEVGKVLDLDLNEIAERDDMQLGQNHFGLFVWQYAMNGGTYQNPIIKEKEEAEVRLKADKLLSLSEKINADFMNKDKSKQKTRSAAEIVELFYEVFDTTYVKEDKEEE